MTVAQAIFASIIALCGTVLILAGYGEVVFAITVLVMFLVAMTF